MWKESRVKIRKGMYGELIDNVMNQKNTTRSTLHFMFTFQHAKKIHWYMSK
jgi:hypothetical protein